MMEADYKCLALYGKHCTCREMKKVLNHLPSYLPYYPPTDLSAGLPTYRTTTYYLLNVLTSYPTTYYTTNLKTTTHLLGYLPTCQLDDLPTSLRFHGPIVAQNDVSLSRTLSLMSRVCLSSSFRSSSRLSFSTSRTECFHSICSTLWGS